MFRGYSKSRRKCWADRRNSEPNQRNARQAGCAACRFSVRLMKSNRSSIAARLGACVCAALLAPAFAPTSARADEHLFGWVRGAETLPHGHADAYQFITLRTGKVAGTYRGWDFNTEVEYGITDQLQVGIAVEQHYFHIREVEELANASSYRFGGLELSAKYRVLSPFKDKVGLALRFEAGYLWNDDVAGIEQEEVDLSPEIILHKNFLDDTLIFQVNAGIKMAWGKKPAEGLPGYNIYIRYCVIFLWCVVTAVVCYYYLILSHIYI